MPKAVALERVTSEFQEALATSNWQVVGVGYKRGKRLPTPVGDRSHGETYYLVVIWPEAQRARANMGLEPSCFHATLGFHPSDIHTGRMDFLPAE